MKVGFEDSESLALVFVFQVDPRLLNRIPGAAKGNVLELPELAQAGAGPAGGREQHIGVEEEPIHLDRSLVRN
jgi:hypothetical protein